MASEKKVGGVVYRCGQVAAKEALALFGRVGKVFDPEALAGLKAGLTRQRAQEEYLLLSCSPGVSTEELNTLIVDLAEMTTAGPDPAVVGVKPESMADAIELAFWVLEVQFRGFLSEALASGLTAKKESEA